MKNVLEKRDSKISEVYGREGLFEGRGSPGGGDVLYFIKSTKSENL